MSPIARDKSTSMEEWCTKLLPMRGKAAGFARALIEEEEHKLSRLAALAASIGLPTHETHSYALPQEAPRVLKVCRDLKRAGWKVSVRLLDRQGRLLFRDVDITTSALAARLHRDEREEPSTIRVSPYKDPTASGTVLIAAGDTCLELVYGPHYWLTKAAPEGASIFRCRYEFPYISVTYSTDDLQQRAVLFRHLKTVVRMTLGVNIRQLPELRSSLYAEYHWRSDAGYKFLDCSYSSVWTGYDRDGTSPHATKLSVASSPSVTAKDDNQSDG